MNKFSISLLFLVVSSAGLAEKFKFINGDASAYTEVCIASVKSEEAALAKLAEYDLGRDLSKFTCNGMRIKRFAAKYQSNVNSPEQAPIRVFAFRNVMKSDEASLCIAAATSNAEYMRLKSELYHNNSRNVSAIACNNMPLRDFARKYGNNNFRI